MRQRKQSGIALITVLLILALATVAAVSMTSRQQLDIRRTTNILLIEQAYMALLAGEESAKRLLIEDAGDNQTDGFGDLWNDDRISKASTLVGEFTVINAVVEDLQGRFNINNLVENSRIIVNQNNHSGFVRLLVLNDLPEDLADAAYDWIDNEPLQYNNGAEDAAYSGLEKPYSTPNLDMVSASEMNRLNEVNFSRKEDYDESHEKNRDKIWNMLHEKNKKVLIALPQGTLINVNNPSSPDIYHMLIPRLEPDDAQALYDLTQNLKQGTKPPYGKINVFWDHGLAKPHVATAERMGISVNSEYFLFRAEASNGDLVVYSSTILQRTGTGSTASVQVVHRSYGKLGEI